MKFDSLTVKEHPENRTTAPHVWAAGDVTPDLMLANLAELEARHAVEDMYGLDPPPIIHEAQSSIYFLSPEVAAVGLDDGHWSVGGQAHLPCRARERRGRDEQLRADGAGAQALTRGW